VDRRAYDETRALLSAAGLTVRGSRYEHEVFGSWWIEVEATRPLRIVWDGKDHWAIVQIAGAADTLEDRDG
jgi:hypothetical protein